MFCPLIRDKCKMSECVMWLEDGDEGYCLLVEGLVEYLDRSSVGSPPTNLEEVSSMLESFESEDPKKLAEEVLEFINQDAERYEIPPRRYKRVHHTGHTCIFAEEIW